MFRNKLNYKEEYRRYKTWVPPGHFYSPIHKMSEVDKYATRLYAPKEIHAIESNTKKQLDWLSSQKSTLDHLASLLKEVSAYRGRYDLSNGYYGHGDALIYSFMLNQFKPRSIVEVGSGYSSAVLLDMIDEEVLPRPHVTFVEPYSERLRTLVRELDDVDILEMPVQDISMDTFRALRDSDILFVDSTHVSKAGSDVNHLIFDVLPELASGVIVHFHDIGTNFEYPYAWLKQGRAWNEAYLLRAFLMYNSQFEIMMHNAQLYFHHESELSRLTPFFCTNPGGSIWLRKM